MGTVFGYCIGEFVKKFTKKLATYTGAAIMFLSVLAYNEWITVNWRKIDKDLLTLLFRGSRQAQGMMMYFSRVLTHAIPLAGGFFIGFKYSVA